MKNYFPILFYEILNISIWVICNFDKISSDKIQIFLFQQKTLTFFNFKDH